MTALIVSTSYNAGEYIERCVQSILDQTEEDMRAVCLMDGSEDVCLNGWSGKDHHSLFGKQ